ncbi:hypothetical protein TNCV_1605331 [Trichonephila clavipes]|nr:hypothetical protein TNCV_1605331 [Trichonephila clavipes]
MDHVILNQGQVTWMTPELAPPSPKYTPWENVSALDRFSVHRCPARRDFVVLGSNSLQGQLRSDTLTTSYTRAFGDGPRHFEPWSSDEDATCAGHPSPNIHTTPTGGCLRRSSVPLHGVSSTLPHRLEDVRALDRLNVHRPPTRRVFSGTRLKLMTRRPRVRYLGHKATAATSCVEGLMKVKYAEAQSPHVGGVSNLKKEDDRAQLSPFRHLIEVQSYTIRRR